MSKINTTKTEYSKNPSKVKGPIRCHKCQLVCRDAEHYLNHICKPTPSHLSCFGESSFSRLLARTAKNFSAN